MKTTKYCIVLSLLVSSFGVMGFGSKSKDSQESMASSSSEKNSGDEMNLEVKKFTLKNGLRLLVHENHKLPIFSYYTFFDVGGRHEGPGTTGATHFLEHMMFKGAKKYGPGKFDTTIEGNGGKTNAYTNFDNTVYYESLPIKSGELNMVERLIDMEADRMNSLALVPAAFEKERGVIMEERKMRYENSPRGQLYLEFMQAIFENTPYGGSVIGDVADLKSLSRDQVMDYFKKFYTPDNAIIVIAGDVDADEVYKQVKEKFGPLSPSSKEMKKYRMAKDSEALYKHQGQYKRHIKLNGTAKTPMFMLGFPGDALGSREGFVRDILASILGQGQSSYLNQKYVMGKRPLLSSISAANYTLKYNGVFWISGELLRGVNLKKIEKMLLKDISRLCDTAIDERSLQKTKNQYLVGYISEVEKNAGIAHFLGMRENVFGDYSFYKKELEIYNSITTNEVKKSCKSLFNLNKHIMVSIWDRHAKGKK
jgi:zinc protease